MYATQFYKNGTRSCIMADAMVMLIADVLSKALCEIMPI